MLQNIRGTESGCHPGLVFATTVHLKLEENEYLSKMVLLTKQYSALQRLYVDVHVNFMVIIQHDRDAVRKFRANIILCGGD